MGYGIKRLVPNIHITVGIKSLIEAERAAHLRQFIDAVTSPGSGLLRKHADMVDALNSVLEEADLPGVKSV